MYFFPKTWQLDTSYLQNLDQSPPRKKQNSDTSPLFADIYLYFKWMKSELHSNRYRANRCSDRRYCRLKTTYEARLLSLWLPSFLAYPRNPPFPRPPCPAQPPPRAPRCLPGGSGRARAARGPGPRGLRAARPQDSPWCRGYANAPVATGAGNAPPGTRARAARGALWDGRGLGRAPHGAHGPAGAGAAPGAAARAPSWGWCSSSGPPSTRLNGMWWAFGTELLWFRAPQCKRSYSRRGQWRATKMLRGLEPLSREERLRDLGLFRL